MTSITGLEDVLARFERLKLSARKKHVRKGVNEGTKILLKAVKARVPKQTGLLKKSLGRKVKVYRGTVVGLVGPRRGFKREVRLPGGATQVRDPGKYAHLAEKHKPFIRPAASEKPAIVAAVEKALAEAVKEF